MFEQLTEKIQKVFKNLRGQGKISEENIEEALKEVRLALLDADVNVETTKIFLERVKAKALGKEVALSLTPGQVMVKIVHEELIALLTPKDKTANKLKYAPAPPTLILLAGLQGTGKTTTAAKLALWLKKDGRKPGLVAADLVRPAAIDQLAALAKEIGVPCFRPEAGEKALDVCQRAVKTCLQNDANILILDTAGRLQIDEQMMNEIAEIQKKLKPTNIMLVVDAMTGQNAVQVATAFHARLPLTGLVLTKADGDARGGAIFSITSVTGVPIQFVGVSEKMEGLEAFYPDRMASRILGMGDMLTLIEKAEEVARQSAFDRQKMAKGSDFNLDHLLDQLRQLKKMGSMDEIINMLPGDHAQKKQMAANAPDEKKINRMEAIILSMTAKERQFPQLLDGSRKRRIAAGSGTQPSEINTLLKQYDMMRKMAKKGGMMQKMQNMMGGGAMPGGFPPGALPPGFPR
ncbi:MAG TPA: signal recognition particle protein [bacterium]|jgi:signal recognition particle subunit SRP54|nr:signal recognition particle protein [bacterium]